jgi:hypothetical protein
MNNTRYNNILSANKNINKKSKRVIETSLSNNTDYNNYLKGRKGLLSKLMVLSSNNIQQQVQKSGKNMDYSQYIRYKNYNAKAPRLPNIINTPISVNSPETTLIAADGASPTANTIDNCWGYINQGSPDKVNWYFYADGGFALNPPPTYKVSDLECFYILVKLNNPEQKNKEFNKPWITVYSQPKYDSFDASWYRSRWNYSGFHDNGNSPENLLESGTYVFYIGNYDILNNKHILNKYPRINLANYTPNPGPLLNTKY